MQLKVIKLWICKKCGHRWANRKAGKPIVCPKCHKYTWDDDMYKLLKGKLQDIKPEGCSHHWIIETANGATSKGVCKHCNEERYFANHKDDINEVRFGHLKIVTSKLITYTNKYASS